MRLFLQLCCGYAVASYLVVPGLPAPRRHSRRFLLPFVAHTGSACAFINLGLTQKIVGAVLLVSAAHVLLGRLVARHNDDWRTFIAAQSGHVALIAIAGLLLSPLERHNFIQSVGLLLTSSQLYLLFVTYVSTVFGGGWFVQRVTQAFLTKIEVNLTSLKPGLPQAGTYIGWIERFLVLTFVIVGNDDAVGYLIAVKALARFPEIKEDAKGHFAEYFLVGTLTSVGLALTAGVLVKRLLPQL